MKIILDAVVQNLWVCVPFFCRGHFFFIIFRTPSTYTKPWSRSTWLCCCCLRRIITTKRISTGKNTTISECVPNRQKLFLFFFLSFTCHFSLPYIFDLSTSWALLHHHHHHLLYHLTRLDDLICTALYSMQRTFVCCIWNRRQAIKDRLSMQGTTFQVHHF